MKWLNRRAGLWLLEGAEGEVLDEIRHSTLDDTYKLDVTKVRYTTLEAAQRAALARIALEQSGAGKATPRLPPDMKSKMFQ
jgi:hypothetical protein